MPATAPLSRLSTLGLVAPTTAIEQPSQLMPASQKACTTFKGPRGCFSPFGLGSTSGICSEATCRVSTAASGIAPPECLSNILQIRIGFHEMRHDLLQARRDSRETAIESGDSLRKGPGFGFDGANAPGDFIERPGDAVESVADQDQRYGQGKQQHGELDAGQNCQR